MTDRDRLIELIKNAPTTDTVFGDIKLKTPIQTVQTIADYLLANGVIVPPCKVGDKAWFIFELDNEWQVCGETVVDFSTKGFYYSEFLDGTGAQILVPYEEIGERVFFDNSKAEAKLKELNKNA